MSGQTVREVLLASEHEGACNAAYTAHANQTGRGEGALPSAPNVICLENHDSRKVRTGPSGGENGAEVLNASAGTPDEEAKAHDGQEAVEDEHGEAKTESIANNTLDKHEHHTSQVRRCTESLSSDV